MKKIAQRFCKCGTKGFKKDEAADMWVCAGCGLPHELYYVNHRASQPPGIPIIYAQGDEPVATRVSASLR